jgi:Zn ribbon nucleic-acid-binding protein
VSNNAPGEVKIECLRCRHIGRLTDVDLARRGIKPNAAIATFIKRLRCRKCGSQSVRAERTVQKKVR